jgi:hypothetical protein
MTLKVAQWLAAREPGLQRCGWGSRGAERNTCRALEHVFELAIFGKVVLCRVARIHESMHIGLDRTSGVTSHRMQSHCHKYRVEQQQPSTVSEWPTSTSIDKQAFGIRH